MAELADRLSAQVISSITPPAPIDVRPDWAFFGIVTAPRGELNQPRLIFTVDSLISNFGTPDPDRHLELMTAYKIIESGIPGYIVRIADTYVAPASLSIPDTADSDQPALLVKTHNKGSYYNGYRLVVTHLSERPDPDTYRFTLYSGSIEVDVAEFSLNPAASSSQDSPQFIMDASHELYEFDLPDGATSLPSSLLEGEYIFKDGNDGCPSQELLPNGSYKNYGNVIGTDTPIEAADFYTGQEDPNGFNHTGSYLFLQNRFRAQFWPTLGYPSKKFISTIQGIASRRKDCTVVVDPEKGMTLGAVCDWAKSKGAYKDTAFLSGFNLEVYWDWLWDTFNGVRYMAPPSQYVVINSIRSFMLNGQWFPVAGDNRGVIQPVDVVTQIPSVTDRDRLITHSVNPIYDTGVRGIQIYGNETLNPVYSDLSAAHIARTLIYIRSTIDDYTETRKFELNDSTLWSGWVSHVRNSILDPIKSRRGLMWFRVTMGSEITSSTELAQRKVRGRVELQFTPDAEVFLLEYVVNSSAEDNSQF